MYGSEYNTYMRRTVSSKKESSSPFLLAQTYVLTLRMNACCGLAHGVNGSVIESDHPGLNCQWSGSNTPARASYTWKQILDP